MSSSLIRQYASRALYPIRETPVAVAGDTLESAATGAVTGYLEAKGKLDAHVGKHKIPLDAAGGIIGSFAGVFLPVPHFLRRAADRLTAIASHRLTKNYVATGKFAGDEISDGLADAGIAGESDPILQAAAGL